MSAVAAFGTQTATLGTEHTLATITGPAAAVLVVNLKNLVAGEHVDIYVYLKGLTGDTITTGTSPNRNKIAGYDGPWGDPVVDSPPIPVGYEAKFTLVQTGGTGRAFDWHVFTA